MMPRPPVYSPTRANLELGTFVLPVVTSDPTAGVDAPPDGTCLLYLNGTALTLCAYTRASGWKVEALS